MVFLYLNACFLDLSGSSQSPLNDDAKRKRKSSIALDEQASPKKSLLPLTAGTAEDDWIPEAVAALSNVESKRVKPKILQDGELFDVDDNEIQCKPFLHF